MGGLGVFAWLAIGTAAGWVISRLMVTAGDDALRGTAAGMIGLRMYRPTARKTLP